MTRVEMDSRCQAAIQAGAFSNAIKSARVAIVKAVLDALLPTEVPDYQADVVLGSVAPVPVAVLCQPVPTARKPVYRMLTE